MKNPNQPIFPEMDNRRRWTDSEREEMRKKLEAEARYEQDQPFSDCIIKEKSDE